MRTKSEEHCLPLFIYSHASLSYHSSLALTACEKLSAYQREIVSSSLRQSERVAQREREREGLITGEVSGERERE